ncbi:hypothetical protein COOONC_26678 [Cooperia oncophora]
MTLDSAFAPLPPGKAHCPNKPKFNYYAQGRRPDPAKIEAIQRMPAPKDIGQLRAFLGLVNFYGTFVNGLHNLRAPLDALQKGCRLLMDPRVPPSPLASRAFHRIKAVLRSDLLLTHYDASLPLIVAADASTMDYEEDVRTVWKPEDAHHGQRHTVHLQQGAVKLPCRGVLPSVEESTSRSAPLLFIHKAMDRPSRGLSKLKREEATSDALQTFLMAYRSTPCISGPDQLSPRRKPFCAPPGRRHITTTAD